MDISTAAITGSTTVALSNALRARRSSSSAATISALIAGSAAPPAVICRNRCRSATPRSLTRRIRRARRRTSSGECGENDGFSGDGDGDDGPFGGGGSGGGKGWGFGSWNEWEESGQGSDSVDPAFDFIYELMCWMALSNCTHFAFKRACRLLAAGRAKAVPLRFVPSVC